jgi:hypothetical protein
VFEAGSLPAVHAHLLDDEVALLRLQTVGRRCTPRSPHERIRVLDALKEACVQLQTGCPVLDDVVNVDHRDADCAAGFRKSFEVFDDVLLFGVLRRARVGECAAVDHDVVLHVLDDQDRPLRVDVDPLRDLAHRLLLRSCS